jgi:hypothetical protein
MRGKGMHAGTACLDKLIKKEQAKKKTVTKRAPRTPPKKSPDS